jgi:hypothetical protein
MADSGVQTWPGIPGLLAAKREKQLRVPRRWLPQKLAPEPLESNVEFDEDTTQDALPPDPPTLNYRPQLEEPDTVVMPIEAIETLNRAGFFADDHAPETRDDDTDTDTDTNRDPWAVLLAESRPVYCEDDGEKTPVTQIERPLQRIPSEGVRQVLLKTDAPDTEVDLEPLSSVEEEESEYVPLPSGEFDRIDTEEDLPDLGAVRWVGPLLILVMVLAGISAAFVLYSQPG